MVVETPAAVCDTSDADLESGLLTDWKVTVIKV